jgi:hypothetical protein
MATLEVTAPMQRSVPATRPAQSLQTAGGIAALLEAVALIVGVVIVLIVVPGLGLDGTYYREPAKVVPFIVAHQGVFILGALTFVFAAVLVVPIVAALHARLQALSPALMAVAGAFGAIGIVGLLMNAFIQYAEFQAMGTLSTAVAEQAFAGATVSYTATELAGLVCLGLWTLLLSWVVIGRGGLPRWLGYFGLLTGVVDVLVLVGPPIGELFGIVWFLAVGISLLRAPTVGLQGEPRG